MSKAITDVRSAEPDKSYEILRREGTIEPKRLTYAKCIEFVFPSELT